jgi:hypothetical protein
MDIVFNTEKNPIGTFKRPLGASTGDPSSPTLYTPASPKIPEPSIFHPKNINIDYILTFLLINTTSDNIEVHTTVFTIYRLKYMSCLKEDMYWTWYHETLQKYTTPHDLHTYYTNYKNYKATEKC